jgi:hypothetical protein
MWVLIEILVRLRQRSKRILKVETRRIVVSPAKNGSVLWKKICRFHFEPITQFPDGCRLLIFLRGFRGEKQVERPFWMMVLERSSQAHELASCLEAKRGETKSNFDIVTLSKPSPVAPITTFPPFGLSLYMGGIYLLLHGVPLLFVAIEKDHPHSATGPRMGPEAAAMVNKFVLRHFSNAEQFRHFFLTSSVCLIITGIILLACGWWMMNRKTQVGPTLKDASIFIRKS